LILNDLDFENHLNLRIRFLSFNKVIFAASMIYFLKLIKLIVVEFCYL